ncbi:MAG: YqgE/AlgH family protein [Pseudomonadota bacterium]|nr:YqgE/AlgH family protein [Pseudomonadota bacterium]MDE3037396.1 YqgE/AlgH family protein [Pseudomonadota bacterium]
MPDTITLPPASQENAGSLAGHLLIATPVVQGTCFDHSVIYLCAHNESGAMGIIVNYPVNNIHLDDILKQLHITGDGPPCCLPVHFGGPVEANRGFVVHSADYTCGESMVAGGGIAVTASLAILQALAAGKGPAQGMLVLGYAGWAPRQLETEIEGGSWIVVPASPQLLFDTDNQTKWNVALSTLGIDMGHYSPQVGHA